MTANIPYSSNDLDQIHEETSQDPTLKHLIHYILNGWPCDRRQLPQELHPYWNFREDLSVKDGIATKGSRLLVPSTPWRKALEQIHEGYQGLEKYMLKAREAVYWPGINDDIREMVEKCVICQSTSRAPKPVGNISKVPPHACHTLGTNLFYWNRIDFLVVSDYFTKFLIVRKIPNTSTHAVIKELENDLHRVWTSICTQEWQWLMLQFQGIPAVPWSSTRFTISQAAHTICKAMDFLRLWWAFWRNWWKSPSMMDNRRIMDYSSTEWHPFPAPFHHHLKPSEAGNWGLHFTRSLQALGSLWNHPGSIRNWWNISLVLPPITASNLSQDSLSFMKKVHGYMSGRLESLTSQPRSLIPTGSSFQTVPSWEGHGWWSSWDHYLLISSWKPRPRSGTSHNLFPQAHPGISKQCSQTRSNQPYQ